MYILMAILRSLLEILDSYGILSSNYFLHTVLIFYSICTKDDNFTKKKTIRIYQSNPLSECSGDIPLGCLSSRTTFNPRCVVQHQNQIRIFVSFPPLSATWR